MFSNTFYQSLLWIIYFNSDIECILLSYVNITIDASESALKVPSVHGVLTVKSDSDSEESTNFGSLEDIDIDSDNNNPNDNVADFSFPFRANQYKTDKRTMFDFFYQQQYSGSEKELVTKSTSLNPNIDTSSTKSPEEYWKEFKKKSISETTNRSKDRKNESKVNSKNNSLKNISHFNKELKTEKVNVVPFMVSKLIKIPTISSGSVAKTSNNKSERLKTLALSEYRFTSKFTMYPVSKSPKHYVHKSETKAQEEYWNEFLKLEKNSIELPVLPKNNNKLEITRSSLATNLFQLTPFVTATAIQEFWDQSIRNSKPQRSDDNNEENREYEQKTVDLKLDWGMFKPPKEKNVIQNYPFNMSSQISIIEGKVMPTSLSIFPTEDLNGYKIYQGTVTKFSTLDSNVDISTSKSSEQPWTEFIRNTNIKKKPTMSFRLVVTTFNNKSDRLKTLAEYRLSNQFLHESTIKTHDEYLNELLKSKNVILAKNNNQLEITRTSLPTNLSQLTTPFRRNQASREFWDQSIDNYTIKVLRTSKSFDLERNQNHYTRSQTLEKYPEYEIVTLNTSSQIFESPSQTSMKSSTPSYFYEDKPDATYLATFLTEAIYGQNIRQGYLDTTGLQQTNRSHITSTTTRTTVKRSYRNNYTWPNIYSMYSSPSYRNIFESYFATYVSKSIKDINAASSSSHSSQSVSLIPLIVTRSKNYYGTYFFLSHPVLAERFRTITSSSSTKTKLENKSDVWMNQINLRAGNKKTTLGILPREKKTKKPTGAVFQNWDAKCFICGLNLSYIPADTSCSDIFDSSYEKYHYKRAHLKQVCNSQYVKNTFNLDPKTLYRGGCFLRFVELGSVYTERGCRTWEPTKGKSYISCRLARLEMQLWKTDSDCVTTPVAILTPFDRSISLWTRYRACVCVGNYCNKTSDIKPCFLLIIFNILLRM